MTEFQEQQNYIPVEDTDQPIPEPDKQVEMIQYIPKGVHWNLASTNSIDPGHKHTSSAINSGSSTDGQVLTSDGAGGVAWEDVTIVGTYTAYEALTAGNAVCLMAPDTEDQTYASANQDADQAVGDDAARTYVSQGFKAGATTYISQVALYLKKNNSPSGDLTVHIYSDNSGVPGSSLGSGTISGSSVTTSYQFLTATFSDPISVTLNTAYHIVVTRTAAVDGTDYFLWGSDTSSPTYPAGDPTNTTYTIHEGTATPAWTLVGSAPNYRDAIFKTYKEDTTATAQVRKTKGTSSIRTFNFIGYANSTVSAATSVAVTRFPTKDSLTSIIPGRIHYISDTAGAISTTVGTYELEVGIGASTTSLALINRKSALNVVTSHTERGSFSVTNLGANPQSTSITTGFQSKIIYAKFVHKTGGTGSPGWAEATGSAPGNFGRISWFTVWTEEDGYQGFSYSYSGATSGISAITDALFKDTAAGSGTPTLAVSNVGPTGFSLTLTNDGTNYDVAMTWEILAIG